MNRYTLSLFFIYLTKHYLKIKIFYIVKNSSEEIQIYKVTYSFSRIILSRKLNPILIQIYSLHITLLDVLDILNSN